MTLLDYGAGNVRSVRNAIRYLGFNIKDVRLWLLFTSYFVSDRLVYCNTTKSSSYELVMFSFEYC